MKNKTETNQKNMECYLQLGDIFKSLSSISLGLAQKGRKNLFQKEESCRHMIWQQSLCRALRKNSRPIYSKFKF